jgi:hypothetical protein
MLVLMALYAPYCKDLYGGDEEYKKMMNIKDDFGGFLKSAGIGFLILLMFGFIYNTFHEDNKDK